MLYRILLFFIILPLAGCAALPTQGGLAPESPGLAPARFHKVESGQTLWRISRMYGLELQNLIDANRLTDSTRISPGQLLRIPGLGAPEAAPLAASAGDDEEFIWPLRGKLLLSFGDACPDGTSRGIAIAPAGRDMVVASRSGKVVFYSDNFLDLGRTLIVEHPGGFWTVYGRNAEVFVKAGDTVARGAAIARTGRAGRDSATYLYFELRKGHVAQNPNFYLSR